MKKTFIFSLVMTLFIYVGCKIDSEETTRNATTTSSDGQSLNAAQQAQKGVRYNIALAVQTVDLLFTQR